MLDEIYTMAMTLRLSFYAFAFLTLVPMIWNLDEFLCLVLLLSYCAVGVWVVTDVDMDVKNNTSKKTTTTTTGSPAPSFITRIKVDI